MCKRKVRIGMVSLLTYRIVVSAIYRTDILFKKVERFEMISNRTDYQLGWKNPTPTDDVHLMLFKLNRTLLLVLQYN